MTKNKNPEKEQSSAEKILEKITPRINFPGEVFPRNKDYSKGKGNFEDKGDEID